MKDRLTTASLPLERSKRNWNRLQPLEQSLWLYLERPQGVSKKPLLHTRYTRNRGGNVEQSWCFRGETFVSDALSDDS